MSLMIPVISTVIRMKSKGGYNLKPIILNPIEEAKKEKERAILASLMIKPLKRALLF